jgi:endo-1,4-beta-xylanase
MLIVLVASKTQIEGVKMKHTLILFLLVNLILSACAPVSAPTSIAPRATLLPIATATMKSTPTTTATPRPTATVVKPTSLLSAPDNTWADTLTSLEAGAIVYPIAKYGDFIRVELISDKNITGFVPQAMLSNIPTSLPILDIGGIPWVAYTRDLEAHLTIHPDAMFSIGDNALIIDNSKHDYYNDSVPYLLQPFSGFRLTFQISTNNGQYGSIKLADNPNNDAPEWWKGIRRVDFGTSNGYLQIDLRDGIAENSATTVRLGIRDSQTVTVVFHDAQGREFSVYDQNGKEVRRIDVTKISNLSLANGLFPERTVYIGRVVAPHSKLTIRSLSLEVVPEGKFTAKEPTLRELAEKAGISLGTEFGWWRMQDPRYYDLIFANYNTLILSEFSWKGFWRGRGDYDFETLDRIVDWAIRHGFRVRASHLVWGATEGDVLPDWLVQGNFSRDEYIQILKEHVTTVVSHYKGRVTEWSIANEAISRSAWKGSDFWMDKIGPEYIELSFQWAREADPDGILIFNEFNNESPRDGETRRIVNKMYETVKRLKSKGVPIDVVGMQMHLLLKYSSPIPPKKQDVVDTMRKFGELGVRIFITEFDVDVHKVPGSQQERWKYQADLYRDMVEACLESGVCTSFATWGVSDSTSWITCQDKWCVNIPDADPLMFDKDFRPKPAYFAVRDVLLQKAKVP